MERMLASYMEKKKQGILVVSFGTSYEETRKKNIDVMEQKIGDEFKEYEIRRAFTSEIIRRKLEKRDNIKIDNVPQALERMKNEGFEKVLVSSLHIIPGEEYEKIQKAVAKFDDQFEELKMAKPLLYSKEDHDEVIKALQRQIPNLKEDESVVFMGHGSEHHANSAYIVIQYLMEKHHSMNNVFMGTVEGYPELDDIIPTLEERKIKKVHLMPFMLVAGDHAINDMASDEEDSWRTILEEKGFEVETHLVGLGENEEIQNIFVNRVKEMF